MKNKKNTEKKVINGWILPIDLERYEKEISEIIPVFQRKFSENYKMLPVELIIFQDTNQQKNKSYQKEEKRLEDLLPWAND